MKRMLYGRQAAPRSANLVPQASDGRVGQQERMPGRVVFVYAMWVFVWYDLDWLLEALTGSSFFVKTYALLFAPVCILLLRHLRRDAVFWPYLLIIAIYLVWMPFVLNRGYLINGLVKVLQYSLLTALTVSVIETPRQLVPLLKLFLLSFVWFGLQGLSTGRVIWHQNFANQDSYGPFMTIALAFSYYIAIGTSVSRYRYLAAAICVLGVVGAIVSQARGAIIGLCVVVAALAVRTPRKMAFLGYGALLALAGYIAIMVKFPRGEFWNEMATITGEGISSGTGQHRWVLWQHALELFLMSPLYGVGPGNYGPYAAEYFSRKGMTELGAGLNSPLMLYEVSVHNDYLQIMAEQGLVGLFALIAVFVYFWKHLTFLRTEAVRKTWAQQGTDFIDPRSLALGLEAAMIGFMVSSIFYPQLFINYWMWSIMMLTLATARISRRMLSAHAPSKSWLD